MRPDDLVGRREPAGGGGIRPRHVGHATDRFGELATADLDDPAGAPDLLLLRRQGRRLVRLAARLVGQLPRFRVERERVAFLRVLDRLTALDHGEPEVQSVAPEDVAHRGTADDDHLESCLVGNALEARGSHLARAPDWKAVARHDERLAAMHALAEVRHEVAERPRFPARVEGVEALRHTVVGRRDLIRVDGVELFPRYLGVPEDERLAVDELVSAPAPRSLGGRVVHVRAGDEARPLDRLHTSMVSRLLLVVTPSGTDVLRAGAPRVPRAPPGHFPVMDLHELFEPRL